MINVRGYCPMGCGMRLMMNEKGTIICTNGECPHPLAVSDLLSDQETEHVVTFGDRGFTIRHPLRERLNDHLLQCDLHDHLTALNGPPVPPGTYCAKHWPTDGGKCWTYAEIT